MKLSRFFCEHFNWPSWFVYEDERTKWKVESLDKGNICLCVFKLNFDLKESSIYSKYVGFINF